MNSIVFLGPPGVGKGTQACIVAELLGVPAISTGQIFRDNMDANTELGQRAREYMDSGRLVPDSVTDPMVQGRLDQSDTRGGFILDGYPRNLAQTRALDEICRSVGLTIDAAVDINAPKDILIAHMLKRACEENRPDDNPVTFAARLDAYAKKTAPVTDYYREAGLLVAIDGVGTIDQVTQRIVAALRDRGMEL